MLLQMQASPNRITSHVGSRGRHGKCMGAGYIHAVNISWEAWSPLDRVGMTFTMLDAPGSDQYAVVDASHVRGAASDDRWRPPIPNFLRAAPFR